MIFSHKTRSRLKKKKKEVEKTNETKPIDRESQRDEASRKKQTAQWSKPIIDWDKSIMKSRVKRKSKWRERWKEIEIELDWCVFTSHRNYIRDSIRSDSIRTDAVFNVAEALINWFLFLFVSFKKKIPGRKWLQKLPASLLSSITDYACNNFCF